MPECIGDPSTLPSADEEDKSYYQLDSMGNAPYLNDLLDGKIKIYDIPQKHRTDMAFIYAIRWARDFCERQDAYTEKKIIEHLLLSDIIQAAQSKDPRYSELHFLYEGYYRNIGLNIFNGTGRIYEGG